MPYYLGSPWQRFAHLLISGFFLFLLHSSLLFAQYTVQCQTCCLHFPYDTTYHVWYAVWAYACSLSTFFFPIRSSPIHFLSFDIVTSEYKNKRFNLCIKPTKVKTRREYSHANRQQQSAASKAHHFQHYELDNVVQRKRDVPLHSFKSKFWQ